MDNNFFMTFPGITSEEIAFLQQGTTGLDDEQKKKFMYIYSSKRKNSQEILLLCLLGFICIAGIHRLVLGQVGMGIVYILTGGFCFIGTIVDVINYQTLTSEYNRKMAYESFEMVKMGF